MPESIQAPGFTQRLGGIKLRRWKTVHIHTEYALHPTARYGVYTLTLLNVDHNCPTTKSIYLVLENVDLPTRPVPRRSLLALRLRNLCILCNTRTPTYCAVNCGEPSLRKLCKRCANETMVTERNLSVYWMVSGQDLIRLSRRSLRYYCVTGSGFVTWIPKYVVCKHFTPRNSPLLSWELFMAGSGRRCRGT